MRHLGCNAPRKQNTTTHKRTQGHARKPNDVQQFYCKRVTWIIRLLPRRVANGTRREKISVKPLAFALCAEDALPLRERMALEQILAAAKTGV